MTDTLLYFHGFNSAAAPEKLTYLGEQLSRTVEGFSYPFPAQAAFQALDGWVRSRSGRPRALIGTSLGGFWARCLGNRHGIPHILINPAIHPSRTLRRHIGPNVNYQTGQTHEWTAADTTSYREYEPEVHRASDVPALVILALDDPICDARASRALFEPMPAARVMVFAEGGHRFSDLAPALPEMRRFLAAAATP